MHAAHDRARDSPSTARSAPPAIAADGLDAMLAAARQLIASLRIARSRRRRPRNDGDRIDLRRTARARRGARFVILIDGSRSTAEHAGPMLQFAHALCLRSRRTSAFVFSTELRDVTRALRERDRAGRRLPELGEAWGGGTRIGDNLLAFVREHGTRLLSPQTVVLIFSDGLDVGGLDRLERAMRQLRSRSAGVVWAASPCRSTALHTVRTRHAHRAAVPRRIASRERRARFYRARSNALRTSPDRGRETLVAGQRTGRSSTTPNGLLAKQSKGWLRVWLHHII